MKAGCVSQHPYGSSPPPGTIPTGLPIPLSGSSGSESDGLFVAEPDYLDYVSASSGQRKRLLCFWHPAVSANALCFQAVIRPFVRTDLVTTTISCERLEESQWNLPGIFTFTSHHWWPDILEVKGHGQSRPSRSNLVNSVSHEPLEQSRWNF